MKQFFIILVLTSVLLSCSKEESFVNTKTQPVKSTKRQVQNLSNLNLVEHCCKDFVTTLTPESWCCEAAQGNCLPCVTIYAEEQKTNFETAIEIGMTGIVEFFDYAGNWNALFPYLADYENTEILEKLLSGDYSIIIYEDEEGQVYYLATSSDGSDKFALPLKTQEE